jgi:N-acetylmuramoyl-L-alanine amidase
LNNQSVPTELAGLIGNTGAVFGTLIEEEVNQVIGEAVAKLLEAEGIVVDILPATVPPGYIADAFISIHADGNTNSSVRGFKIAGPRRDYSGKSGRLVSALESTYAERIPIPKDDNVTRRMTAYYAFNWPRYEHAIHPFTPAAIIETGFLTNAADRAFIVDQPELVAQAIAEGVLAFIAEMPLPMDPPVSLLEPEQPIVGAVVCAPIRAERRGRENPDECIPSVVSESAVHFILDGVASSSVTLGQTVSVTGVFRPVQVVDNYFWFPYEVAGFLEQPQIDYR